MAFSLLSHLKNTRQQEIQALLPTVDEDQQCELLAIMLGMLIMRDRQDSAGLYQALHAADPTVFWQAIDQQKLNQLAAQYHMAPEQFHHLISQFYLYAAAEITSLDDTANLEQSGVSELIQGQSEYLMGQTPDQVWDLLNLHNLQGETLTPEQPVDLNASIASLSKMMHEASQVTHHDNIDQSHPEGYAPIEAPRQRDASPLFLNLEPIIALIILIILYALYLHA